LFAAYRAKFLDLATEVDQMQRRELPKGWTETFPSSPPIHGTGAKTVTESLAAAASFTKIP